MVVFPVAGTSTVDAKYQCEDKRQAKEVTSKSDFKTRERRSRGGCDTM